MARFSTHTVKSCGKAHAYCGVCRPEVSLKIAERNIQRNGVAVLQTPKARAKAAATRRATEYRPVIFTVKQPCSKRHAQCGECRPDIAEAARERTIKQFEVPGAREAASINIRRYVEDNPRAVAAAYAKGTATRRRPVNRAASSERATRFFEDPVNRLVQSADQRRYHDNDHATGGAQIPGGERDAHLRARAAYVAEQEG